MYVLVYITTSGIEESEKIARVLLDERLAACTNILPSIKSIYRGESDLEEDSESLLIAKTDTSKVEKIIEKVKSIHSYDIPCILAIPIIKGSDDYLKWLDGEIG
ncbi:MAG: divalent-cation tolerance protein CutA [Methanobacteriaceae archaeon]|jgi:periplasmic divalent cation tolerance protein|nr:divalent-cation tolerance protein CutA [Methanobacteriaceae archaeon]